MPRRKKSAEETPSLLDITAKLRSGPCVPALREAVKSWTADGRNGITDTTHILLNYWFEASHKTRTGLAFKYYVFRGQMQILGVLCVAFEQVLAAADFLNFPDVDECLDRPLKFV